MRVVLASGSPRRKELLKGILPEFEVIVSGAEENVEAESPDELVELLSYVKAADVFEKQTGDVMVIGSDTVVALQDQVLGKPRDGQQAFEMLKTLQGNVHQVYTGVTVLCREGGEMVRRTFSECTEVEFFPMTDGEINWYISTGEPMDKAGAYGIQGLGGRFVKRINGDYNNVVGLPVAALYQELKDFLNRKDVVIFDLDGTLSDTIASMKFSADQALARFGYGPFTEDQYKKFVGDGAAKLVERCLEAAGSDAMKDFEEAFAAYLEIFGQNCMYQVHPYDGIRELLTALKEDGCMIAVLSNKPHEETIRVVETLFGKDYFDCIQGQMEGVERKPSPEGVFLILEKLHTTIEHVVYLGDTATDMKTGKSAGAFTVGALWGFRDRQELEGANADAVIENPLQLLDYMG